jgi:hypothetical protein
MYGFETGITVSSIAARMVPTTGAYTLKTSRETFSRYGKALSSSIVGLLGAAFNSSRSVRWTSGACDRAKSVHVTAVEVVSWPATKKVGTSDDKKSRTIN